MKIIGLIVLFFFSLTIAFCSPKTTITEIQSNSKNELIIGLKDTLNVQNLNSINGQDNFSDKNIPWIVALFIGIFSALINLLISRKLMISNERNLQRQIDSSKQQTIIEYKATIAVKNRQEWINDLRQCLSELLTSSALSTPNMKAYADYNKNAEKVFLNFSKIELLLNGKKPEQVDLIDSLTTLVNVLLMGNEEFSNEHYKEAKDKVVTSARKLFEIHWNKIKKLE